MADAVLINKADGTNVDAAKLAKSAFYFTYLKVNEEK